MLTISDILYELERGLGLPKTSGPAGPRLAVILHRIQKLLQEVEQGKLAVARLSQEIRYDNEKE